MTVILSIAAIIYINDVVMCIGCKPSHTLKVKTTKY